MNAYNTMAYIAYLAAVTLYFVGCINGNETLKGCGDFILLMAIYFNTKKQ